MNRRALRPDTSGLLLHFIVAASVALELADVLEGRTRYVFKRLLGEKALVPGDQYIGKGLQPRERVILQHLVR